MPGSFAPLGRLTAKPWTSEGRLASGPSAAGFRPAEHRSFRWRRFRVAAFQRFWAPPWLGGVQHIGVDLLLMFFVDRRRLQVTGQSSGSGRPVLAGERD